MPKTAINTKDHLKLLDFQLFAANGTVIHTYSQKILSLKFNLRRCFRWEFIIADVKTAILGADFLAHYALLVDLQGGKLIDQSTS